jgi:hypothetical protein
MRPLRKSDHTPNIRLGPKLFLMLTSLSVLWLFAAWVTVSDGVSLWQASQRDNQAGRPTKQLINVLQEERRASLMQLGQRNRATRLPALAEHRKTTDQYIRTWRSTALKSEDEIRQRVDQVAARLKQLELIRQRIDAGGITGPEAMRAFNTTIDACLEISRVVAELDDQKVAADGRALIELTVAREHLAREDALMAGVLARGRLATGDHARLLQAIGARESATELANTHLPQTDRGRYQQLTQSRPYTELRSLEAVVAANQRPNGRLPLTAQQWQNSAPVVLQSLDQVIDAGGDDLVERAAPGAIWVLLRLALAAGLGLFALITAIVVSLTTVRQLARRLTTLANGAHDTATRKLREVIRRLDAGEEIDLASESAQLEEGADDVGRVAAAVNLLVGATLESHAERAKDQQAFTAMLANIARRGVNQASRQLMQVDQLERHPDLPKAGAGINQKVYAIDHMATLQRRFAEAMLRLAGDRPQRNRRSPASLVDVIRAAAGEVEHYTRVAVPTDHVVMDNSVKAHAVPEVVAILAELIENGLQVSPPDTQVTVTAARTGAGLAIEVADRGLGLEYQKMTELNAELRNPPSLGSKPALQYGLWAVAVMARSLDAEVTLTRSPYGGVTAVVLLPDNLLQPTVKSPAPLAKAPTDTGELTDVHPKPDLRVIGSTPANGPAPQTATASGPGSQSDAPAAHAPAQAVPSAVDIAPPPQAATPGGLPVRGAQTETPGGLPVRVPQSSLAPGLRTDEPLNAPVPDDPSTSTEEHIRTPEETRRIMGAFQTGSQKGRQDAAARMKESGSASPADSSTPSPPEGEDQQ